MHEYASVTTCVVLEGQQATQLKVGLSALPWVVLNANSTSSMRVMLRLQVQPVLLLTQVSRTCVAQVPGSAWSATTSMPHRFHQEAPSERAMLLRKPELLLPA